MRQLVNRVKCRLTIVLNDATEIDISLQNLGTNSPITNYVTEIDIDESTNTQNNNPVGVVSANTIKLVLNSNDRSLFPDNPDSPHYGLMDNTAIVKVELEDEDGIIEFNPFYVSKWISNITAQQPNKVIIECTDILSIIGKNKVPSGIIVNDMTTKEAFVYMIDRLNSSINSKYTLKYNMEDIDFNEFNRIEYDNLDTGSMSDWLNTLSQCTLTNIYINRQNNIVTDYCLDDKASESVCTLSDKVNITDASTNTGGLVNYTGVTTNYIVNSINNSDKLTTISNQKIVPGINKFDNLSLNNKVFRITAVKLLANGGQALRINDLVYDKRNCNLEIENLTEDELECTIEIYGQSLKENKLSVSKIKTNTNEMLEVNNILILPEDAEKYTDGLVSVIGIRNSSITITGFFNPRIKLGDTVYVDVESSIKTKGYYKVIGIKMKIRGTIKTTLTLIKVFSEEV